MNCLFTVLGTNFIMGDKDGATLIRLTWVDCGPRKCKKIRKEGEFE